MTGKGEASLSSVVCMHVHVPPSLVLGYCTYPTVLMEIFFPFQVPYSIAQVWQVIWSSRHSIVGRGDVATADGVMQLKLVPVACATREGLYITSDGTP